MRDRPEVTALLAYAGPPPSSDHHDPDGRRAEVARAFAGQGWQVPRLLELMARADDLSVDSVAGSGCRRGRAGGSLSSETRRTRRRS